MNTDNSLSDEKLSHLSQIAANKLVSPAVAALVAESASEIRPAFFEAGCFDLDVALIGGFEGLLIEAQKRGLTEGRLTFDKLQGALARAQFTLADWLLANINLPPDPETLCGDYDRGGDVGPIFFGYEAKSWPGIVLGKKARDFQRREDVLVALLYSFGRAGMG